MPTPPVALLEVLYRQLGPGGDPLFYDPTRQPPIHSALFLPGKKDTDGLSLIRASYRTEIWSGTRIENPDIRYRLAKLTAEQLSKIAQNTSLGSVSYDITPDAIDERFGEPFAHCSVPEVNRTAYDANRSAKRGIKEWAVAIANALTEDELIGPFQAPTDQDNPHPPAGL